MRSFAKRMASFHLLRSAGVLWNLLTRAWYDGARFFRFVAVRREQSAQRIVASIMFGYHSIEKGLALRAPRPGFGRANIEALCKLLQATAARQDAIVVHQWMSAHSVLAEYVRRHDEMRLDEGTRDFIEKVRRFVEQCQPCGCSQGTAVNGGTEELRREDVLKDAAGDFARLTRARRSVRQFDRTRPLDKGDVCEAIRLAQCTPSPCNRQSARVYHITDRDTIDTILQLQNGARGFAEEVQTLLVIAGDLRAYMTTAERNQVYVDAGLFAMAALFALTAKGLGTCPLHWCVTPKVDRALRAQIDMDDAHIPAMLIAVGNLPETFRVAHSERLPGEAVLIDAAYGGGKQDGVCRTEGASRVGT